jgi:hypothetical protein
MATQDVTPFRWATTLIRCCVPVRDGEMIAGDLLEEFNEEILPARGWARAQWWYLRQVASFLPCRETRLALRVCTIWFVGFCAAAAFSMTRPMFAPAYGVAVFLFAVPSAAFYVARKTDWFGLAFVASMALTLAMVGAMAATVLALYVSHPPMSNFWFPIEIGGVLAFLSALVGKCSLPSFEATFADALRDAPQRTLLQSSC